MLKIIRILRSCFMKIFSTFLTVNILKLNFWLVICIAKNFIWTTLKMICSIFRFFCTLRFQIYKYCPIITNHTSMEILFIQLSDYVEISISKNLHLRLVLWSRVTITKTLIKIKKLKQLKVFIKKTIKVFNDTKTTLNCITTMRILLKSSRLCFC